ncbi:MAG TPA: GWxTD domain-containing protein, partial [Blastocatellia bacterium]|nr:GWxTD domain-containing protein [Blastocatellia bacterium]
MQLQFARTSLQRIALFTAFSIVFSSFSVFAQDDDKKQNKKKKQSKEAISSVYKKWLDDDVRWIITDEERNTFKALKTDDEREQFIEQFWLRRDPDPDT